MDEAFHPASDKLRQLLASLSPKDEARIEVEGASISRVVSGGC